MDSDFFRVRESYDGSWSLGRDRSGWSGRRCVADVARLAMRLFDWTGVPVGRGVCDQRDHGEDERHGQQAMECLC